MCMVTVQVYNQYFYGMLLSVGKGVSKKSTLYTLVKMLNFMVDPSYNILYTYFYNFLV